jgi:hypothetical protein
MAKYYFKQERNYAGEQKEPGELFELLGLRNDPLLIEHVYVVRVKLEKGQKLTQLPTCDACAKSFANEGFKIRHDSGRIHPRSPNYEGEEARSSGEKPVPTVKELLTSPGKTNRYQ